VHDGSRKAVLAALFANLGIAAAKAVGWLFTGAASMLAEAVHSLADSTNQALLLWGGEAARRPPTEEHPFGFGQERYFWSFVVALVIFSLGGIFALVEGIEKLRHPHELSSLGWAVGILLFGVVLEAFSFRTALRESRPHKGQRSWWRFIRQTRSPELPVVILEDLGALAGLLFALTGVGLAALTGDARFDALGSVTIGILLVGIAVVLAHEMKGLLIGESAEPRDVARIREALLDDATLGEALRIIHLRTLHVGPDQVLVAAKLGFPTVLTLQALAAAIDRAEQRVRRAVPTVGLIFLEPDVYDPGRSAAVPDRGRS
jgi:cation diffusion facilitator family transporter